MKLQINLFRNRLFFTALALLFAITFSFVPLSLARADGQGYNRFWGQVTTTGGTPAAEVVVTGWVNGVQAGTIVTDETGQYGYPPGDPEHWPSGLVLSGNIGDTITFKISGVAAKISRFGTLDESDPSLPWDWEVYDPPQDSMPFRNDNFYGADLVYEPPASDTAPPAQVTDLHQVDATTTEVMLEWTATGDDGNDGTAAYYQMRYRTGGDVTDANWESATVVNNSWLPLEHGLTEHKTIGSLNAGETYYFALKAFDEANNPSPLSNSATATTDASDMTAPAKITDLRTGTITAESIELLWTATGDDGNVGTANHYDIRYRVDEAVTEANWTDNLTMKATGIPAPQPADSDESFWVDGLDSSTLYYFAIKAYDEANLSSPISNDCNGTTKIAGSTGGGGGGGGGSKTTTTTTTTTPVTTTTAPVTTTTTTTAPVATTTTTTISTTTTSTTPVVTTTTTTPVTTTTTTQPAQPVDRPASATFSAGNMQISKSSVAPGETVQVSVDLTNIGGASGTCGVELLVNNVSEATRSLVLAAGETKTVTFSITKTDSGTYTVSIYGVEGTFRVVSQVSWALIAEIIGGVVALGIIIFIVRRVIMVRI